MANTILTPSIIAAEALMLLDNNLVMANQVYREYEAEYSKSINGYETGATITIRRPTDFTVRQGAVAVAQDVVEGTVPLVVNLQRGVDFQFTGLDLSLSIKELSKRVIKPAMIQLANEVDSQLMALYKAVPNWVGTPGTTLSTYAGFTAGPKRLDNGAVPQEERSAVLSPDDYWSLATAQAALFMQPVATDAYRRGEVGELGGVETFMTQNIPVHTTGIKTGSPLVNGAAQNVTYLSVKDTNQQTFLTKGWTATQTGILKAGDVFTIAGVFAVNPVTKATLSFLKPFVVVADANSDGSGLSTVTISPPIITTGAFKNVSAVPADSAVITTLGATVTLYPQNLVFHRNAFALAMVPMVKPPGAVDCARKSYKGLSMRVIPYYDGVNDISNYRVDILFGVKAIDPRLAVRVNGP